MIYPLLGVLLTASLLSACQQEPAELEPDVAAQAATLLQAQLPQHFTGTLPCADCPGIDYQLKLMSDHWFVLRRDYQGRNLRVEQLGRWSINQQQQLLLHGETDVQNYRIIDADTLSLQDQQGQDIDSLLSYQLTRAPQAQPLELQLELRGNYRHAADSGLFTECLTGQRWRVANDAGHEQLQQQYLNFRAHPAQALLTTVNARLTVGSDETAPLVQINKVHGVWPGETCGVQGGTAPLENTRWRLTRINNQPVLSNDNQQAAYLLLQPLERQVSGSDGCNQLMGSYQLGEQQQLRFRRVASTMMACPLGMETAQALHLALERVRSWQVTGQHLQLYDTDRNLLARFEAVAATPEN